MAVVQLRPQVGRMMYRDFWEAGLPVFSLFRFRTNGTCECGDAACEAKGKHPRPTSWQHTPIWDEDQMEQFEELGYFDTGYGVVCRGLLVVDIDARNGGVVSYRKLLETVPEVAGAGLAVQTGSGGGSQHLYFRAPADVAFVTHLPDYPGIDFKSSGYVVGPGSAHISGGVYTADGSVDDIEDAPAGLIELLKRPERHRAEYQGYSVDIAHDEIADMLGFIDPDADYSTWLSVGMAIHHATGGSGFTLWDAWSGKGGKYEPDEMDRKWHSFGRSSNPVTLGTLIHHAQAGGWVMPVSFVPDQKFNDEAEGREDGLPFDISGVDLTAPPGFVGEVAAWIDSQSFRSRKHLATAAALVAIGNIGGLRYVDDVSGVTANLFVFCVAGSRTGKDAILKGVLAVMRAAGITAATHGAIKSEQEMFRNLIRHQASFYMIDEVAHMFGKIKNAQKSGSASYLEGVPALLMNAYTKADDYLGTTGDLKEELRKSLTDELAKVEKIIAEDGENPFILQRKRSALRGLDSIEHGIERPFVSMMGVTTPDKFSLMMNKEMATEGFIGRSLIFNERDTAPRSRMLATRQPLPEYIGNYACAIWTGGEFDMVAPPRIENYDKPSPVPTDPRAREMLEQVLNWMEDKAEESRETGLESLYLGAYEIVAKVSLILAIPERLRTQEHVRWAFAIVRRDIEEKSREVIGNESVKHAPIEAMRAKILNLVEKEQGEKEGVIVARLDRTFQRADILAQLEAMTKARLITCETLVHARNGKEFRTYGSSKRASGF